MRLRSRSQTVEDCADRKPYVEFASLVLTADVISLADPTARRDNVKGSSMVFDIEPIANIPPCAVDRQRLAGKRIKNEEWNQLLRKMIWPVIVRAVGDYRWKAV